MGTIHSISPRGLPWGLQKVGPSILRDFYTMVPPNARPAVLYVRNNLTESDYEVIRDIP